MATSTSCQRLISSVVGMLVVGSVVTIGAGSAIAQPATELDPLQDFRSNSDQSNDFLDNPSSTNVFDLYHRLNLSGGQTLEQFSNRQSDNINSAASDFRTQQMQRLQNESSEPQPTPSPQP